VPSHGLLKMKQLFDSHLSTFLLLWRIFLIIRLKFEVVGGIGMNGNCVSFTCFNCWSRQDMKIAIVDASCRFIVLSIDVDPHNYSCHVHSVDESTTLQTPHLWSPFDLLIFFWRILGILGSKIRQCPTFCWSSTQIEHCFLQTMIFLSLNSIVLWSPKFVVQQIHLSRMAIRVWT